MLNGNNFHLNLLAWTAPYYDQLQRANIGSHTWDVFIWQSHTRSHEDPSE
jgi:hypothetical protein